MSSHVNSNPELIVCDHFFNEFASFNGSLDLVGFTKMMSHLFNHFSGQLDSLSSSSSSSSPSSCSTDQLVQVFNIFDLDGDGYIDRDEYKSMWSKWLSIVMGPKSTLIVVDVQNDFISGSLALENLPSGVNCSSIIPVINSLVDRPIFEIIVYTLDWHPEDHISFLENVHLRKVTKLNDNQVDGGEEEPLIVAPFDCLTFDVGGVERKQIVYPRHCVQSSWGSQLHDQLKVIEGAIKIYKGTNPDVDSYSAFRDNEGISWTQLDGQLRARGITDVYICGLAYDICVYHTIKDSLALNYRTIMIEDCCKGTDGNQVASVRQELIKMGCLIVHSNQVEPMVSGRIKSWQLAYQATRNLINSKRSM